MTRKIWLTVLVGAVLTLALGCGKPAPPKKPRPKKPGAKASSVKKRAATKPTLAAGGPSKVTERFWKAIKSGGTRAAKPYAIKASHAAIDKGEITLSVEKDVVIGKFKINGDKATVLVGVSEKKDEQITTFLIKESGEWKVDPMRTIGDVLEKGLSKEDKEKMAADMQKQLAGLTEVLSKELGKKMGAGMEKQLAELMKNATGGMMPGFPPMAEAGDKGSAKGAGAVFLLPDMGWGDPFIDPRDRVGGQLGAEEILPDLGEEAKKTWQDAVSALTISCIIGLETDLAAIVAGSRVHQGDTIVGEKLKFEIEKITKDAIHLRCISEEEQFSEFTDIKLKKKITF
jgi:hypothetical protein